MMVVQVHSLNGIVDSKANAEIFADIVTKTIAPDSWIEVGGKGVAKPLIKESDNYLVVRQTSPVQKEIEDLLKLFT